MLEAPRVDCTHLLPPLAVGQLQQQADLDVMEGRDLEVTALLGDLFQCGLITLFCLRHPSLLWNTHTQIDRYIDRTVTLKIKYLKISWSLCSIKYEYQQSSKHRNKSRSLCSINRKAYLASANVAAYAKILSQTDFKFCILNLHSWVSWSQQNITLGKKYFKIIALPVSTITGPFYK